MNSVLYSCKTLKNSEMNDKEINLRLMVTKDFNASMLVEKSSPTEEALLRLGNGLGKHFYDQD